MPADSAAAANHFRNHLKAMPEQIGLERACNAIDAITRAEMYLDANVNVPIVFQQLSLTLSREFRILILEIDDSWKLAHFRECANPDISSAANLSI